jgi:hypothetical protein
MSYLGYYQVICSAGHYSTPDVYAVFEENDFEPPWKCFCGEKAKWYNSVNLTNGKWCDCKDGCQYCVNRRIDGFVELEKQDGKYSIPIGKGQLTNG